MRDLIMLLGAVAIFSCGTACNSGKKVEDTSNVSENNTNMEETQSQSQPQSLPSDSYLTKMGELSVTVAGHASLIFTINGKVIHIDPYSKVADYSKLPKADLILLTHEHSDHFDINAIEQIKKANTRFIVSKVCADSLNYGEVLTNGDKTVFEGIDIQAVPAYNIVSKNSDGEFYHPKGRGNGYVLTFGSEKVYVAGDTENIPEMKQLKDIYIAFLPKNTPYTMTDEMFVDAVQKVSPIYLYPYHFSDFNDKKILKALEKENNKAKVLVRSMSNL